MVGGDFNFSDFLSELRTMTEYNIAMRSEAEPMATRTTHPFNTCANSSCVSPTGFPKSTLVARGANTQLDPSCVSAPLVTNVDLFACFAERLFKSSSISY